MKLRIVYTSDTHGRLSAYDFLNKNYGSFGLSRLSSYLKNLDAPYLLLDNGDFLQGSPLLDYTRKQKLDNPVSKVFSALNYSYITVGNHDFNYGLKYLEDFQASFKNEIICANIIKDNKSYFKPYVIHEVQGLKIAIIGLITEFVPMWEKPENIKDLEFKDVVSTTKNLIKDHDLRNKADLLLVLYHGGYNTSLVTKEVYGTSSAENKGFELFQIQDIDILLTGHQHVPQTYSKNNRVALQTSPNAIDFGLVTLDYEKIDGNIKFLSIEASILPLKNYPIDSDIETLIGCEIEKTNQYLSKAIGITKYDMSIRSPLDCRKEKHLLFQLINQIQLDYTKADISAASLPNDTHGFNKELTLNDIAVNFPFENDLVVLEVTGAILKEALEKNASYFALENDEIIVNPQYIFPKLEHYNYDVYDGIEYTMDISKSMGQRITKLDKNGKAIKANDVFTLALNSYRAIGSGGFDMFKKAKKIISYPISYFELIQAYIKENPRLDIDLIKNYIIHK